jgi:hypothetical protein
MTRGDDDDDDQPVDEVALAAARRRLDAIIAKYPELVGPTGPDNVSDWIETLKSIEEGTEMAKEPTTQVAFRLPDSLIARLDRHVERMSKEHPGLDFTRGARRTAHRSPRATPAACPTGSAPGAASPCSSAPRASGSGAGRALARPCSTLRVDGA